MRCSFASLLGFLAIATTALAEVAVPAPGSLSERTPVERPVVRADMVTQIKRATSTRKHRHTTSTKKHRTTSTSTKRKTSSTKKHTSTSTSAKPVSTRIAHVGEPGKQECRSGFYDFRKINQTMFVEYGSTSRRAKYADWINLSGTRDTYALTSRGLEVYLLGPQNPVRTFSSTIGSAFKLKQGSKVTFRFQAVAAKGVATAACMYDGPGSNEIDIEFPQGNYQTNYFKNGNWAGGANYADGRIGPNQLTDRVHSHGFIWTKDYIQFLFDGTVTNTRYASQTFNGFPVDGAPLSFGLWEPDAPPSTVAWANGPADWSKGPAKLTAIFESIEVDCDFTG